MTKDKMSNIHSELAGLIGNIVYIPKEYVFLVAVDGEGKSAVYEIDKAAVHPGTGQVLWFSKYMNSYTKLTNVLQTWGIPSALEDWLSGEIRRLKIQLDKYELASKALHLRIGHLESESSRWREEAARLQVAMNELTEKYYSEVSHDDL